MNPAEATVLERPHCVNSCLREKPRGSKQQVPRLTSTVMEKQ